MNTERYKIYENNRHIGYFNVDYLSKKKKQFSADFFAPCKSFALLPDENGHVSPRGIKLWLMDRIVPKNRIGVRKLLREMGLRRYDELGILKYTSARHASDTCYIDFSELV